MKCDMIEDRNPGLHYIVFCPGISRHCRFFIIWLPLTNVYKLSIEHYFTKHGDGVVSTSTAYLQELGVQNLGPETGCPDRGIFVVSINHSRCKIWSQAVQHQIMSGHSHKQFVSISLNSFRSIIYFSDNTQFLTALMCRKSFANTHNYKSTSNPKCCYKQWDCKERPTCMRNYKL